MKYGFWVVFLFLLQSCHSNSQKSKSEITLEPKPIQTASRKVATYGQAITEKSLTRLADIVHSPSNFTDKTVRLEGLVSAVCQHQGCWLEIQDAEDKAHIKMSGHSFAVPKSIQDKRVAIQGKLVKVEDEKSSCGEEKHSDEGACAPSSKTMVQFEAIGVEELVN